MCECVCRERGAEGVEWAYTEDETADEALVEAVETVLRMASPALRATSGGTALVLGRLLLGVVLSGLGGDGEALVSSPDSFC